MKEPINNKLFDKAFRNELRNNTKDAISKLQDKSNKDIKFNVVTNTKDTTHIVFPNQESMMISLSKLYAGEDTFTIGTVGSAGSVSTASSFGCTFGTAGSVGTIGSAGTVKPF